MTRLIAVVVVVLLAAWPLSATAPQGTGPNPPVRLQNVRLVGGDGRVVSPRGELVIIQGRISLVGDSVNVMHPENVDLTGKTVLPGFVNAHGHVADTMGLRSGAEFYTEANLTSQLRTYARYGITSVASLGGDGPAGFKLRDAQASGPLDRARVFLAGPVINAATPAEAAKEVDRVAAMKPDLIKIRVDDNLGTTPKMTIEVARAVIDQSHKHGLKVAAHIYYLDDAKALLRAGVDFIAHSVRDRPVDDELIGLLKQRNICYCPTLMREVSTFVYEAEPDFFLDPFFLRSADPAVLKALRDPKIHADTRASKSAQTYKAQLPVATANLKRLYDAGVSIAMGTDTGPPRRFQGYFEHLELTLMVKAGMPPAAVIASATGTAARCLGLKDVGVLQPGAHADLLVVNGDPLTDFAALRSIDSVWVGGRRMAK
jgi:imidazolonepropionase-like amidohydrolase